ncbi:MAG: hypothetical protein BMS9Abin20_0069 [Acidimicrobiia bacterium]|nr:MAG: hypothetical protein BMS9Abin20_0069 [Acidimicrobiia bacterium]
MSSENLEELEDADKIEDAVVIEDLAVGDAGDSDTASPQDESDKTEALDELEAEELEMLTEDESNETIVVDEAAEMRAIRRAEIAMEAGEVDEAASDEFVCTSCFLVKRRNQLAAKRKKICLDCAS